jgi:hypothetical protein
MMGTEYIGTSNFLNKFMAYYLNCRVRSLCYSDKVKVTLLT